MSITMQQMSEYARTIVQQLGMEAHPEGGWYVRDWQSPRTDQDSQRPLASLIYFLLPKGDSSTWHKVDADELWLWHGPAQLTLQLGGCDESPAGNSTGRRNIILGSGIAAQSRANGPIGHALVPAGTWQRTLPSEDDVLVSCVVSPGFVFSGFTIRQQQQ